VPNIIDPTPDSTALHDIPTETLVGEAIRRQLAEDLEGLNDRGRYVALAAARAIHDGLAPEGLDEPAIERLAALAAPCPAWCTNSLRHYEVEDGHEHQGEQLEVSRRLYVGPEEQLNRLLLWLTQWQPGMFAEDDRGLGELSTDPLVILASDDHRTDWTLTLAEVDELGQRLQQLAVQARAQR